jgi:hypothetical protein
VVACDERAVCPEGPDWVADRCVPSVCRGAGDCGADEVCDGGECVERGDQGEIDAVYILTPPRVIPPGATLALQAIALDDGGEIVVGAEFAWSTDNAAAVDVVELTGAATGGNTAGTAAIEATAVGTDVTSEPVNFTNPGAPADMDRVIVVDANTSQPIEGAVVTRGNDSVTTGGNGVAAFEPIDGTATVSVYDALHNHVTLVDVRGGNLLVPMRPLSGGARVGGLTGDIDLSAVHTEGDINVGIGGLSLDGELSNFDLQALLGDSFLAQVTVPGLFDGEIPLPGGLILEGVVFGFPINVKDTWYAQSRGGLKSSWTLAGKIDAQEAFALVQGGGNAGGIVRTLLPFFENFDHGQRTVNIEELPRVVDGDDIDGDGDRGELVPDYANFDTVTHRPDQVQRLRTALDSPRLPLFGNAQDTFVIIVGGVINPGIGFVPLGLNATDDGDADGKPDSVILRMAPPHSGLSQGEYAIVAITFDPDELGADLQAGIDLPVNYSTATWRGRSIPTDLDLGGDFLDLPASEWSAPDRTFSAATVEGADLFRVTFTGAEGSWEVWFSGSDGSFQVPTPPQGFSDWSAGASIRVDAFHTTGDIGLDDVAAANGTSLDDISAVSDRFSRSVIAPQ